MATQWIQGATKHPGALHKALRVPESKNIPADKLVKAKKSPNGHIRKMAYLASSLGQFK